METPKYPTFEKIPVPHIPCMSEMGRERERERGIESIDISERLEPLLSDPDFLNLYKGSIRTMDLLDGCTRQCAYCYADAQKPTEMMSAQSILKLLDDERFIQLLRKDKFRLGSSGDCCDHPEIVSIVRTFIEQCPQKTIEVWTSYRRKDKAKVEELLKFVKQYGSDRFKLLVSLDPYNEKVFLEDFGDLFYRDEETDCLEPYDKDFEYILNVFGAFVHTSGRAKGGKDVKDIKVTESNVRISFAKAFKQAGKTGAENCSVHLNTNLWLKQYVPLDESHTSATYTQITPENFKELSQIPYHPDFETPPNWAGGRGEIRNREDEKKYMESVREKMNKRIQNI